MRGIGVRVVLSMTSLLWLWLAVAYTAAQCPSAAFLPSDVMHDFDQKNVTDQLREQIASLEKKIPALFQGYQIDAHAVVVVYRNETIYSTGLVDTHFRIGSITKILTAMGALVLRQRGRLELDDPVKKFLPKFSVKNPYGKPHDITLRELMGHLSGLPRFPCADGIFCPGEVCSTSALGCGRVDEGKILRFISKMQLVRPPWSSLPTYSDLGYALLGHAWEKATSPREPWHTFVRNAILRPLKMHDTGLDFAHVKLAPGEIPVPFGIYPSNLPLGWMGPAGDMYSTALDLAKFLKFLLHPDEELLTDAAFREWTKPTTLFPDATNPANIFGGFALPWEIKPVTMTNNQTATLITKIGLLGTYQSHIAFHPDSQLGVALLTSVTNATSNFPGPDKITAEILQGLIPAVQSVYSKLISSMYSGVYTCKRSQHPIISPNFPNVTFQVLGGSISVPTVTPEDGLVAEFNLTVLENGAEVPDYRGATASLVLKSATEQSFWTFPGPCSYVALYLGAEPEYTRPNFPRSVYGHEVKFAPGGQTVRMAGLGAECYK